MFEDSPAGMVVLMMSKNVFIYTYGCQMNVHDSEKMRGLLREDGYEVASRPEDADLIIFNTCAIRDKAEQKFYSQLGRIKALKKKKRDMRIAVAGCVAQESRHGILKRAPYVDFVLGPQNLHRIRDVAAGAPAGLYIEDNAGIAHQEFLPERDSSIKAWISIMYGCNNFCSYCIVPYTRGREVSRPSRSIVTEVAGLKERGYREVTMLGQNVNSYLGDMDFPGLLRRVDETGIDRIRFVTSHPRDLSDDLISAMAELPRVCEHIHLPLQSGADRILRLMNRGYTFKDYADKVDRLRKAIPGIAITTDLIAGFPGETPDEHQETLRALSLLRFDGIFAFKYSSRPGTRAVEMAGQLPDAIKSERLTAILHDQEAITGETNRSMVGTLEEVLVEGPSETEEGLFTGRTRTNKIVNFLPNGETAGDLVAVKIESAMLHSLRGRRTGQ